MKATLLFAIFTVNYALQSLVSGDSPITPCQEGGDLGSSCFALFSNAVSKNGYPILSSEDASSFCQELGMQLGAVYTPDELANVAKLMTVASWQRAVVGLRRQTAAWRWAFDAAPLRGQGCRRNPNDVKTTSFSSFYNPAMTREKCGDFCAAKRYYGLTAGNLCQCVDQFIWNQPSTACNYPCSGAADQVCGSFTASSVFSSIGASYDNWRPGYPHSIGNCAMAIADQGPNQWLDADCAARMPFLCQFSSTTEKGLPGGFTRRACNDGVCFYLYANQSLAWYDADRFCLSRQGRLAAVGNSLRQDLINSILKDPGLEGTSFWIGASNQDWFFGDGSDQTDKPHFNAWMPTAQDKNYANADLICVELVVKSPVTAGWRSRPCEMTRSLESEFRFICSKNSATNRNSYNDADDWPSMNSPIDLPSILGSGSNDFISSHIFLGKHLPPSLPIVSFANQSSQLSGNDSLGANSPEKQAATTLPPPPPASLQWWDILLIIITLIGLILAGIFITLYLVEKRGQGKVTPPSVLWSSLRRLTRQQQPDSSRPSESLTIESGAVANKPPVRGSSLAITPSANSGGGRARQQLFY